MTPKQPRKPRVVTEATKAKLPRPKRKRPKKETWAEGYAKWEAKGRNPALDTDKHGTFHPKPNVEYDMGTFPAPRAIPCGEDVTPPADVYEGAVMFSDTEQYVRLGGVWHKMPLERGNIPPVAEPFPWPVRVLDWLDDAPSKVRHAVARRLRWLAGKVGP